MLILSQDFDPDLMYFPHLYLLVLWNEQQEQTYKSQKRNSFM